MQVAEVRISSKGIAQSKTTASGQRVPNFGFVVFEEERGVTECLKDKPIHLSDGHRLNVETKKNKPMVRTSMGGDSPAFSKCLKFRLVWISDAR